MAIYDRNTHLIVATSKAENFAKQILEHFGIARYFSFIAGANMDGSRSKKAEVIHYALEGSGIKDRTEALMIGDRENDIRGAKENKLYSIGVLYGYGSREELEKAGADSLAESVADLESLHQ